MRSNQEYRRRAKRVGRRAARIARIHPARSRLKQLSAKDRKLRIKSRKRALERKKALLTISMYFHATEDPCRSPTRQFGVDHAERRLAANPQRVRMISRNGLADMNPTAEAV